MTPPTMSCRTNTTNTAVSLLEVHHPQQSLQAARYRWAGALGTRKIMASVPEVGAQLTPHATAVLEHPRKGETWSCMASFQEVPGLFRAEAGLSHPAPPLLLAPPLPCAPQVYCVFRVYILIDLDSLQCCFPAYQAAKPDKPAYR